MRYYRSVRSRIEALYGWRSLGQILEEIPEGRALSEKVNWLRRLFGWLVSSRHISELASEPGDFDGSCQGTRLLINYLSSRPDELEKIRKLFSDVLAHLDSIDFLCDAGMLSSRGFAHEFWVRLGSRVLPHYDDYTQMTALVTNVLPSEEHLVWLKTADTGELYDLVALLSTEDAVLAQLRQRWEKSIDLAIKILSLRLASIFSMPILRSRQIEQDKAILFDFQNANLLPHIANLESIAERVHQSLEMSGVSIDLVFELERIKEIIGRLRLLGEYRDSGIFDLGNARALCAEVLTAHHKRDSILGLLRTHFSLLSRKIVERTGVTGEQYVARSRREFRRLFWAAAGGGALTLVTSLNKTAITHAELPLFVEGTMAWINYSFSFFVLQSAHLILATKTPALTASVLAKKLSPAATAQSQNDLGVETRLLIKSAAVGVLGNVMFVSLLGCLIDLLFFTMFGTHVFSEESAAAYLRAHSPWLSFTAWYAAYTGFVLWFGSAIGAWFENWYVFHRLPDALREHRYLLALLNKERTNRLVSWLNENVMGLATNVALGFLLAYSSIV